MLGYESNKEKLLNLKNNIFNFKSQSFYDKYWKLNKKNKNTWNYGITIVDNLIKNYKFKTVLDAGCGSGDVVRYLMSKGYDARGIELSTTVLKKYSKDLLDKKIVFQGSLTNMPFKDKTFDVIFSSEVLEHIPEEEIQNVIEEFYRVSKKYLFLTISLRPSSNFNKYHITLKERVWWENKFIEAGFEKDTDLITKLQVGNSKLTNEQVLQTGPTKSHIHEMDWFINNPPYDFNGELEPWYFIFKKVEK
jgi:ubiquinone/menaquinone biosynthesis C-methylase UbiE